MMESMDFIVPFWEDKPLMDWFAWCDSSRQPLEIHNIDKYPEIIVPILNTYFGWHHINLGNVSQYGSVIKFELTT